jgi:hypothetical protein
MDGRYHTSSHANANQRVSSPHSAHQSYEPLLLQRKACHPDEYDAAQERGEAAKNGFRSVATAHAKTFPNSLPTAQSGTFSEDRPLKVRKTGKG